MSTVLNDHVLPDARDAASTDVPPIPDFQRAHGPATRSLLRRTGLAFVALWVVGLIPLVLQLGAAWKAIGLGLLLPGGGQLYAGHPVWAAVAVFAFFGAIFLWWLVGPVLLPPAVWLGAAVIAALTVGSEVVGSTEWAVPATLVAVLVGGTGYQQVRFIVRRVRGRAYNEKLAAAQPQVPCSAPVPVAHEASEDDLKSLRYLMDLALQPIDSWDGFFFVKADQFREGAVRYQLNFVSYAAAMYQYTHAPAFTGYVAEAQRNMIEKMTHKSVWRYWALENLWGNLRWNPDPVVDDDVMYSGYLGLMLGLYETTTGDRRYHETGCLELRWNDRTTFRHDFGTINAALADNFARARLGQFPCEPNWIYPMCNTFGVNSMLTYDRLQGTDHAKEVVEQVRRSYENGDFCEPDGRLTTARSEYFGFRHPMVGNMGDAITTYLLNPIVPDIARRTWWLLENHHLDAEDAVPKHKVWNKVDPGNYGINTDRFTRAVLSTNAREFGNDATAEILLDSLADRIVEQDGARRYRGLSVWGNLYLTLTRFGRQDSFRGLVRDGFPDAWRTGPRLAEVAYPEVLVARAVTDGESLDLVLRPGNGGCRTTLAIERLVPGARYAVTGARVSTVIADGEGRALVQIDLSGRIEVRVSPTDRAH